MKFGVSANTCRGRKSPELRSDLLTATMDPAAPSVFHRVTSGKMGMLEIV